MQDLNYISFQTIISIFNKYLTPDYFNIFICNTSIIRMMKCRRMKWAGHVAGTEEKMNAYRIMVGKSERKRPLGRPRSRWVDNIKMNLRKIGWDGVDWIHMAQDTDQ
jgi:hypothetical protein